jgi:hypothetical protein
MGLVKASRLNDELHREHQMLQLDGNVHLPLCMCENKAAGDFSAGLAVMNR